ncbi:MAG: DNA polymerase I [Deltaproteobacteria bacterium]|nr:DNA polymerase I [Deltaproteobacteria bacterium]
MEDRERLIIIDGQSYIYRAFFAIRRLSNSKGMPTNAIYGFVQMLNKVIKDLNPKYLCIVFDSKEKTFRHDIFTEYKANRPPMPDDLSIQIPHIHKVVDAYKIRKIVVPGVEADDVIATLVKEGKRTSKEVIIITGDKDLMQLVDEEVKIFDTMKDKLYLPTDVEEKYGVRPEYIIDLLALSGDSSDNIPGARGVGEKTAQSLVRQFGHITDILKKVDEIEPKSLREKIQKSESDILLSYRLLTLKDDVVLGITMEDLRYVGPDKETLNRLFAEYEFRTFIEKEIDNRVIDVKISELKKKNYGTIDSEEKLLKLLSAIDEKEYISIDTETDNINPLNSNIIGISLCLEEGTAYYIPIGHRYLGAPKQLNPDFVRERLNTVISNKKIIGQNLKYDLLVFLSNGYRGVKAYDDAMIAAYLLDPEAISHSLKTIAKRYLDYDMFTYKEVTSSRGGRGLNFSEVDVGTATLYSCEDADVTYRLINVLKKRLESEGLYKLYREVEIPLLNILTDMEFTGVYVNVKKLNDLSEYLRVKIMEEEDIIYKLAGEKFNINSPKSLSYILFDKLKLPVIKQTQTGTSTDSSVLEELQDKNEIVKHIIEYRTLTKIKSTYVEALSSLINKRSGRIHTSFNQTATATGRLSSSEPNLQNIPVRTEIGKKVREAFEAQDGYLILSADYSQIELRVFAHLSKDPTLIKAFMNGEDIHTRTACEIFDKRPDEIDSEMRRLAKTINFGIIYGMGAFSLAKTLGISRREAQEYINRYFDRISGVKRFIKKTIEEARRNQYVKTIFGRIRYLKNINSKSPSVRQQEERIAVNTPIQGSAADIIKLAMINISRKIEHSDTKMILQVHDELVFEVPKNKIEEVSKLIKNEMENVVSLDVPLVADIAVGKNWAEAK